MLCIKELDSPGLHHFFVEEAVRVLIEKKAEHRRIIGTLFHIMIKESVINIQQICQG